MQSTKKHVLKSQIAKEIPQKAGVYNFLDAGGNIIYVGKANNLRSRMISYFYQNRDEKTDKLVQSINSFRVYPTKGELEALLLEDLLIKMLFPPFNVRQKKFRDYRYLSLSNKIFPVFRTIKYGKKLKREFVFGPFRDRKNIEMMQDILHRYFQIRPCSDINPVKKCMYYDINMCDAPCLNLVLPLSYTHNINKAIQFLNGENDLILKQIKDEINIRSGLLEFEEADKLNKLHHFAEAYIKQYRFYRKFKSCGLIIQRTMGKENNTIIFKRGQQELDSSSDTDQLYSWSSILMDSRIMMDRAGIVYHWLRRNKEGYKYEFVK